MRFLLLPAAMLLTAQLSAQAVWPDEGPLTWDSKPTEAAITANDLRSRLYRYAHDSMAGREAGTFENVKATNYIASEFARLGLVPAGENGTWFQEVPYGRLQYHKDQSVLALGDRQLDAGTDWAPLAPSAANAVSGEADLSRVPAIFGGRFGDSTTALGPEVVRGKVVVFTAPQTVEQQVNGFTRRTLAPGDYTLAQRNGAAAILVIQPVATNAFNLRTAVRPTVESRTAAASVTPETAAGFFDRPLAELQVGASGQPVTARWSYDYTPLEYPTRNVLAVLPGADPALRGQYVLVGAHSDHVGRVRGNTFPEHDSLRAFNRVLRPQGANDRVALDAVTAEQWAEINALIAKARAIRPPRLDSINNGADDDGSGTVVLLEIAEAFARGERPARSLIFHSHAAEEKGLLGSQYWTTHPTLPTDSIVAAFNMDMVGKGRVTDVRFGGPYTVQMLGTRRISPEFGDVIDSLNAVRSEPMVIDWFWDRTNHLNRFCRSDQVSYVRLGIPTSYFSSGYSVDYHQPTDEPQYIDYDKSARIGRFVHDIMMTIGNRPHRLSVLPWEEQDPAARCGG
ncbi:MAG TPA: M28 family peptidase [Gemmatimonadales bacterium]|nr:M28 family peptidase [Gemmatimonadales bacterium]